MAMLQIKFDKPLDIPQDVTVIAGATETQFQLNEQVAISPEAHAALLADLHALLQSGKSLRDTQTPRYGSIDRELAGYLRLDDDDAKRKRDMENGKGAKPYSSILQLTKAQLDEAVTYVTTVFFPEEGAYKATAPQEMQNQAAAFTALMNQHSSHFGHMRHFAKFVFDTLRYNIGYMEVDWEKQFGTAVSNDQSQQMVLQPNKLLHAGNKLGYCDPYNTFVDPFVDVLELHSRGRFYATVEKTTAFDLQRMEQRKQLFNVIQLQAAYLPAKSYWTQHPEILGTDKMGQTGSGIDWFTLLAPLKPAMGNEQDLQEVVKMSVWINPSKYGISAVNEFVLWRFKILNGKVIGFGEQLDNAHGYLPIVSARAWDDNFGTQTASYAEMLLPYQRFASFQLNTHIIASRKALYGITLYDKNICGDLSNVDLVGAKIPVRSTMDGNFDKVFKQFFDTPDTQRTLEDVAAMDQLMQKILPTDLLKQVTDLQRATQYQAAATVQGANRRNLKMAQLIEAQAFYHARIMQMYNILQYQETMKLLDSNTGTLHEINPATLRDAGIEFVLGAGLRGMDKLVLIETSKEILNMILQSQTAAQNIDVVLLIDYITSLLGDFTSFSQFKYKNEFDRLPPDQKNMAFQLLQQAMQQQADQQAGLAAPAQPGAPA